MTIKKLTSPIFWQNITDDKPNIEYFDSIVENAETIEINIHYLNDERIQIFAENLEITYLIVTRDNGDVFYYYYESVDKIIDNGYILNYRLDLYATCTMPVIRKLLNNNIACYFERTGIKQNAGYLANDELLSNVKYDIQEANAYTLTTSGTPSMYYGIMDVKSDSSSPYSVPTTSTSYQGKILWASTLDFSKSITNYLVLKSSYFPYKNSYFVIPIVETNYDSADLTSFGTGATWSINSLKCYNEINGLLTALHNSGYYITQEHIVGIYSGPDFIKLLNSNSQMLLTLLAWTNGSTPIYSLGFFIDITTGSVFKYTGLLRKMKLEYEFSFNEWYDLYYGQYLKVYYHGEVNNYWLINGINGQIYFNDGFYVMSQDPRGQIFSFSQKQAVLIDDYTSYVNANKNSWDAGLSTAAQQAKLSLAQGTISGLTSFFSSALSGNYIGAFSAVSSTAFGAASSILNYENYKQKLEAQQNDTKAVSQASINSGSIIDIYWGRINTEFESRTSGSGIDSAITYYLLEPTAATYKEYEYILTHYGLALKTYDYFANQYMKNDFDNNVSWFLKLDAQKLTPIILSSLPASLGAKYAQICYNDLTIGVRLWAQTPK